MFHFSVSDDDVVNWYMDEFHEESDESHDAEADGGGDCDLLEFSTVGLCATLN